MLLSARVLDNCVNVNTWDYANQISFTQGDTVTVYIQLIDLNKDKPGGPVYPSGRRYVPANGASLQVSIPSIQTAPVNLNLTKIATQPFTGDGSIWSFTVNSSDNLTGTYTLLLTLTEGSVVTYGRMDNILSIAPRSASFT